MVAIDYYNIVLASFSVIVAVLIGFQIFQVFNIAQIKNDIKKEREIIKEERHKILSILYLEVAKTHFRSEVNKKWVIDFKIYSLKSLYHAFEVHDLNFIEYMDNLYEDYPIPLQGKSAIDTMKINEAIRLFTLEQIIILKKKDNLRQLF